jgi:hypothetical protein
MFPARGSVTPGFAAALVLTAALPLSGGTQEEGRTPRPPVDPYTKGDPAAMKAAGYVSFGPFLWGDDHTNERIESVLGGEPLIWVETEHFRLGSSLDDYDFPSDRLERRRLEEEIARLKGRIPGFNGKVKKVDPWLRLHLYALRVEDLYATFLREFALRDEDFLPADPSSPERGPYLGMKDKFTVLLVEKKSALARYTSTFCGQAWENSYRYFFSKTDNLFAGLSFEILEGELGNDLAFHYALTFLLTQNLYLGFRGYGGEGPIWWQYGLARWFARRIDERCLLYTAGKDETLRDEEEARWEPKVRSRVAQGFFPSAEEMLSWDDPSDWEFSRHMMSWSRVDFVMRGDPAKRRALLLALKEPVPWTSGSREALLAQQWTQAFQALGDGTDGLAGFDQAWAAWVLKTYSKR